MTLAEEEIHTGMVPTTVIFPGTAVSIATGGMVPRGPMVQRYFFQVDSEGQVMFRAETKLGS